MGKKPYHDNEEGDEESDDTRWFIRIQGHNESITMPARNIYTLKEINEYDYMVNIDKYYLLINETHETSTNPYANIKLRCKSEQHRNSVILNIEKKMEELNIKFAKV